jgi:hypothetical protein
MLFPDCQKQQAATAWFMRMSAILKQEWRKDHIPCDRLEEFCIPECSKRKKTMVVSNQREKIWKLFLGRG